MFFLRMITRSFTRQLRRRLLIALTVCLSATVSVSMLGVVFDVGDKLNAELSTYGSNITVQPKADAVVSDLYNTESGGATSTSDPTAFLKESDAAKIKTIFWSFNITSFAPQLNIHATVDGTNVPVVGTWFNKNLKISTGETTVVGVEGMRSWWQLDGKWPKDDSDQGVIGRRRWPPNSARPPATPSPSTKPPPQARRTSRKSSSLASTIPATRTTARSTSLLHGPGARRPARLGRQNRGQGPDHAGERPGP